MSDLFASSIQCRSVHFEVSDITGDRASIIYHTLPGNLPNTNGNYLALWQSPDETVPWDRLPDENHTCSVFMDAPEGDLIMTDLDLPEDSYLIAYSLSPKATTPDENNFCASVFLPKLDAGSAAAPALVTMDVLDISSYSAIIRYHALSGCTPKSHGSWIGIWDERDSFLHDDPLSAVPLTKNSDQGEVALNNFKIIKGHRYTVGYFTGGYDPKLEKKSPRTQLACMVSFEAASK